MGILSGLEPASVLHYFEEICSIPHGSGNTKEISDYCVRFAKERGLKHYQDESNNVIIWKEGTEGYAEKPYVMLQGHLDMVCEKEGDHEIDFEKDGLSLKVEDGMISAEGTTLGGDDGIAIAMSLALLDSADILHPPIEAVFTVDEEIGMLGASALDMSLLKSKSMINIDSEDEGYLLVSCAGGVTATCSLPVKREPFGDVMLTITVDGLLGGHSGQEIDKGRASSNSLIGRILSKLNKEFDIRLVTVEGGNKDNAIPRCSRAVVAFFNGEDADRAESVVNEMGDIFSAEYRVTDPDIKVQVSVFSSAECEPMDRDSTQAAIRMLRMLPQGVQRMSPDIKELVQTSLNLGILKTEKDAVKASFSVRSSMNTEKDELTDRLTNIMEALGGSISFAGAYPAWEYNKDSRLRDVMTGCFKELYGRDMTVYAIHAGVECGLFADSIRGLDAVSIGPDMKDIHTPKEALSVESVKRTWEYLLKVLQRL
ncbi:MAG: aminoacyl-histidine dipeptidase [Lachnospiraceae bacterium]|nr:aminoacyl-histidine dipeptidase [Lachnospiraceae bacterium]